MMGGALSDSGRVAHEYCQKHPAAGNLTIAKMLKRDHPALYVTTESARQAVRYIRGAKGAGHRGSIERAGRLVARYQIPAPEPPSFAPFDLGEGVKSWLILADCHVPYHDAEAVALALDWGKREKCDGVLFLGDLIDCYQLSSFMRDPRRRTFAEELEAVGALLDAVQKHLRPKRVIWRAANHEYRLERYLMQRAPELFGIEAFAFPAFMGLERRGVEWIGWARPIRYHALEILHGDEWRVGMSSPVNPARTAYLKAKACCLVGHQHRTSEHTETTVRGETVTAWSVGCLCDLHPEFAPLNAWNLGAAILRTRGGWSIENRRIVNGELV